jgi:hypothetical protein
MSNKEAIEHEIDKLPNNILGEILHYIQFLKHEMLEGTFEAALLSEFSLKKDWHRPEEDEAWKDL